MTPERVENNIFLVERSTSKADVPSTLQRPQLNTSSTMMMRSLMLLALLLAVSTAFTVPSSRWGVASLTISTTQRNMFSPDPDGDAKPKGLDVVAEGESAAPVVSEAVPVEAPSMIIKNLGRGGEVKEGASLTFDRRNLCRESINQSTPCGGEVNFAIIM